LDKTTATTEIFYDLLSSVCDTDGNNSGNSYVNIGLSSQYINFYTQNYISTAMLKNWVNDAMLCCIVLDVWFFSYRVKFCTKYGGKDIPLMTIPGNQRFIWKTAKKCCLNSEKKLWTISLNLLKKTSRCVLPSSVLH